MLMNYVVNVNAFDVLMILCLYFIYTHTNPKTIVSYFIG